MTHDELEGTMFFRDPDTGNYIRVDKDNAAGTPPGRAVMVFGPRITVEPSFENLLASAPMLYQQLTMQYNGLQHLVNLFDRVPNPGKAIAEIQTMLTHLQNGVLLAQQVSQFGIEAVAKSLDGEQKAK